MKKIVFMLFIMAFMLAACLPPPSTAGKGTPVLPPVPAPLVKPSSMPTAKPACMQTNEFAISDPGIFPAKSEYDHVRGAENAKVTLTIYTDFDCPGCMVAAKSADQLLRDFPNQVRLIVRHMPQTTEKSPIAVQAAEAAWLQGHYWEMHDRLFDQQSVWTTLSTDVFKTWVFDQAEALGMNRARFENDFASESIHSLPAKAYADGLSALQNAGADMMPLPLILINGEVYSGSPTYYGVRDTLALKLLIARQYNCPASVIDPNKQYIATIKTQKGDIAILLYADKAPITVNSFVFLARNGWFDNITFHRVIPGFMAQSGDPSGTGLGGPGYIFDNEQNGLVFDRAGLIAMANAGPNTNGSQFFITYAPAPNLNGGYTIFGEVISGMDVALSLAPRITDQDPNAPIGDRLIAITVEEK
jgi:cyclophilin family peptidyl-prolyl cis-trans isomerase/protein-disulfide isomerase